RRVLRLRRRAWRGRGRRRSRLSDRLYSLFLLRLLRFRPGWSRLHRRRGRRVVLRQSFCQDRGAEMARRRQRDALGPARLDRLKRMTEVAFRAFERHGAGYGLLHLRFVAGDAARRARLPAHRLLELAEEVRADFSGLASLMADHTALRALAERLFVRTEYSPGVIVVIGHVGIVVERRGRLGLLAGFLRGVRVEFGVGDLAVEPEHGQFRTGPFLFLVQVMTADACGRESLGRLIHLFFVEVADEAFRVAGRALFDALCELHAADGHRLLVLLVAGGALEV